MMTDLKDPVLQGTPNTIPAHFKARLKITKPRMSHHLEKLRISPTNLKQV